MQVIGFYLFDDNRFFVLVDLAELEELLKDLSVDDFRIDLDLNVVGVTSSSSMPRLRMLWKY